MSKSCHFWITRTGGFDAIAGSQVPALCAHDEEAMAVSLLNHDFYIESVSLLNCKKLGCFVSGIHERRPVHRRIHVQGFQPGPLRGDIVSPDVYEAHLTLDLRLQFCRRALCDTNRM